jgi:hypothetical protein
MQYWNHILPVIPISTKIFVVHASKFMSLKYCQPVTEVSFVFVLELNMAYYPGTSLVNERVNDLRICFQLHPVIFANSESMTIKLLVADLRSLKIQL